jgi:D-glycero-alpha-D-manno-heptose-7-phosphate kinase
MEPFHGIKREANQMKECLLKGDFNGIVDSMQQGWKIRSGPRARYRAPAWMKFTTRRSSRGQGLARYPETGGGGFMMFFVPPDRRMDVIRTLMTTKAKSAMRISPRTVRKRGKYYE